MDLSSLKRAKTFLSSTMFWRECPEGCNDHNKESHSNQVLDHHSPKPSHPTFQPFTRTLDCCTATCTRTCSTPQASAEFGEGKRTTPCHHDVMSTSGMQNIVSNSISSHISYCCIISTLQYTVHWSSFMLL